MFTVDTLRDMLDLLTTRNWMPAKEGKMDAAAKSLAAQVVQKVIAVRALVIVSSQCSMFSKHWHQRAHVSQVAKVKITVRHQTASLSMDLAQTQTNFLREALPAILPVRNPVKSRMVAKASMRATRLDRLRSHMTTDHISTPTMFSTCLLNTSSRPLSVSLLLRQRRKYANIVFQIQSLLESIFTRVRSMTRLNHGLRCCVA
jgi:hypothetical protein